MAEAETGEGWSRLMKWLREQRDEAQEAVMSGRLPPDDEKIMKGYYAMAVKTIVQAQTISRGEDIKPASDPVTAIMEQIEGP